MTIIRYGYIMRKVIGAQTRSGRGQKVGKGKHIVYRNWFRGEGRMKIKTMFLII